MEIALMILGITMMYSWVHSAVIVVKKVKGISTYESAVMIFGVVGFLLYVIGTV